MCLCGTLDFAFCVDVLEEAVGRFGKPEICNTDQGSQFTSSGFTAVLCAARVRIAMGGLGRWMDNVSIERPWRSPKYECGYLYVRHRIGTASRAVEVDRLLQRPEAALEPRRPNAG